VYPSKVVHLIDVYSLREITFTTPGKGGKTLKDILESAAIPKVFFDVRNDSDALYAHYSIALQGVQDVQLMENASRSGHISGKKFVNGLAKCIEKDVPMPQKDKLLCKEIKERGKKLFKAQQGGSHEVFNARPLEEDIIAYCGHDVLFLPLLRQTYWRRLTPKWKGKVADETQVRVQLSRDAAYQPQGSDKALGPWQDEQPKMTLDDLDNHLPFEDDEDDEDFDLPIPFHDD
jgi:exonuclease 3'-5' domain-containing protein 1